MALGPLLGVLRVGRGHPDRVVVGGVAADGAVDVAGRAVELGVPAVVGAEDVVDVDGEVIAGRPQVHALGQPLHHAAREQPELALVLVVDEGDDQFAAAVVGVLADQRAPSGAAGYGRVHQAGEGGAVGLPVEGAAM
ncbi:hypothetical protein GCM10020000_72020 [Streptomyces olivoverticillatus]